MNQHGLVHYCEQNCHCPKDEWADHVPTLIDLWIVAETNKVIAFLLSIKSLCTAHKGTLCFQSTYKNWTCYKIKYGIRFVRLGYKKSNFDWISVHRAHIDK